MARITKLNRKEVHQFSKHTDVEATYFIGKDEDSKFLQIDTYGSSTRQDKNKKSQSIRIPEQMIEELKNIILTNFKK